MSLKEHLLEGNVWVLALGVISARCAVVCHLSMEIAQVSSMLVRTVRTHHLLFTVLSDMSVFQAVHAPRSDFSTVFRLLIEPAVEDHQFNCLDGTISIRKSDSDGGVGCATLDSVYGMPQLPW